MKIPAMWIVLLFSALSFAQGTSGPAVSRVGRGNFLKVPAYATDGTATTINYCVDASAGNDSSSCIGTSTNCCLTIQAAINKVPKMLRNGVVVNVLAGTYAGFIISGFYADNGFQQTTGGLSLLGTMVTSSLATGSATGTATGGTGGSFGSTGTFGTLIDTNATWTVNDLVGRFVTTVTPTNDRLVITSNTATTITITGTWSAPTGATTYTIQDPGSIANTCLSGPASVALTASASATAAIQVMDNTLFYRQRGIGIQNFRLNPANCSGIRKSDASSLYLYGIQIRPTGTALNGINVQAAASAGFVEMFSIDVEMNSSSVAAAGVQIASGAASVSSLYASNAQAFGSGLALGATGFASFGLIGINSLGTFNVTGFLNGIVMGGGRYDDSVNGTQVARITCGSSSGVGIRIGSPAATQTGGQTEFASIRGLTFATCGTAVQAIGPVSVDVIDMTGSVGTTGFDVRLGGLINYSRALTTTTAGTNAINLDNGAATATALTDVTAGQCMTTSNQGSRACAQ